MAGLPPHIAEIAHRKPDLVRQIIDSHRAKSRRLDVNRSDNLENVTEDKEEDELSLDEEDDDDERTELLRQRRKQPAHPLSDMSHYHATL
jgi:hypothetical protein